MNRCAEKLENIKKGVLRVLSPSGWGSHPIPSATFLKLRRINSLVAVKVLNPYGFGDDPALLGTEALAELLFQLF